MAGAPLANLGVNAVNPNGDIAGVVAAGQMFGQLAQTKMRIAAQQSAQAFGAGMDFFRAEQNAILAEQRAKNSLAQRFGFDEWGKMSEAANAVGQPLNEYMANLDARRGEILNRQQVADEVYRLNAVRPVEMDYDFVRGEALAASAQLRKAADAKLQFASPEAKSQYQALNAQFGQILSDPANQTANAGEIRQLFQNVQQQQAQLLATIPDPPKSWTQRWQEATTPEQRQALVGEKMQPAIDPETGQKFGFNLLDNDGEIKSFVPSSKVEQKRMHPVAEALLAPKSEDELKAAEMMIDRMWRRTPDGREYFLKVEGLDVEFPRSSGGGSGDGGDGMTKAPWGAAKSIREQAITRVEAELAELNKGRIKSPMWNYWSGAYKDPQQFEYTPTPQEREQMIQEKMRQIAAETRQVFAGSVARPADAPPAQAANPVSAQQAVAAIDAQLAEYKRQADEIITRTRAAGARAAPSDIMTLSLLDAQIKNLNRQRASLSFGASNGVEG